MDENRWDYHANQRYEAMQVTQLCGQVGINGINEESRKGRRKEEDSSSSMVRLAAWTMTERDVR